MRMTPKLSNLLSRPGRHPRYVEISALLVGMLLLTCSPAVSAGEAERIARALELGPGSRVADVGAGDGDWTVELADWVSPGGRVFATEVTEELREEIRENVEEAGLENVTVVAGDQESTGLPEGCCDAILLRMVYHHFQEPAKMRASLAQALRPGGRVAIIDIRPQKDWRELPDTPERGGHGIALDDLIAEMTSDGFEVLERHDEWEKEDRYCVVFTAPVP